MSKPNGKSKADKALSVFKPDPKTGISRIVTKKEMVAAYKELDHGNGWDWGRYDSPLAQKYNLIRIPDRGPIKAYKLNGFRTENHVYKSIRKDIREQIISRPCVVTAVDTDGAKGQIECDHKNGRYDDPRVNEPSKQLESDFQPLHKNINTIKREHCKRCELTGKRFDAQNLGFTVSWLRGDANYSKNNGGCIGCYWHDVKLFHSSLKPDEFRYKQKGT